MSDTIQYEQHGAVAVIRLNRPQVFNSFNREMALALQDKLDAVSTDVSVRAVILTGNGKAFCAGQDLAEVTGPNPPGFRTILSEHYNPIITRLRTLPKPVIGAVNGVAAGAGANIALACDIVIAAQSSSFIQAFSKIGLVPDSGGTFFLPRMIGFQKASALMITGDKVSAADAERMGMVYKVLADEEFNDGVMKQATELAAMPTHAIHLIKQLLNTSMTSDLNQQLDLEEKYQIEAGQTQDYREGVTAFMEKRKPVFTGK
ncbi:MAG: 2-(1,2-epoxy-1,2-dihydrophenyl)acetyl-CoA isomerase PaaG [Flavobacteriales bacterium]|nr:2-(1,2-epoxy-1,2-dihydrophenyl)acetyl-CoA isomerase PaaG [Flavobacteriales bacterium]